MNSKDKTQQLFYDAIDPEEYHYRHEMAVKERYSYEHWTPLVENLVRKCATGRVVLDIGCGTGRYTGMIANYAKCVFSVDFSKKMVTFARDMYNQLDFGVADVHHLPVKNESIEAVLCLGVAFADLNAAFDEIFRVLKPNGHFVMFFANKLSIYNTQIRILATVTGHAWHRNECSVHEVFKLLEGHSFLPLEYVMNDGLIWLPAALDSVIGSSIYRIIELLFKPIGRTPFSSNILIAAQKTCQVAES